MDRVGIKKLVSNPFHSIMPLQGEDPILSTRGRSCGGRTVLISSPPESGLSPCERHRVETYKKKRGGGDKV